MDELSRPSRGHGPPHAHLTPWVEPDGFRHRPDCHGTSRDQPGQIQVSCFRHVALAAKQVFTPCGLDSCQHRVRQLVQSCHGTVCQRMFAWRIPEPKTGRGFEPQCISPLNHARDIQCCWAARLPCVQSSSDTTCKISHPKTPLRGPPCLEACASSTLGAGDRFMRPCWRAIMRAKPVLGSPDCPPCPSCPARHVLVHEVPVNAPECCHCCCAFLSWTHAT